MNFLEITNKIKDITSYSKDVQVIIEDDDKLFDFMETISHEVKSNLYDRYKHSTGPITKLRKEVAQGLLENKLNRKDIIDQYKSGKKNNPKKYTQYKNLFSILYPFVTFQNNEVVYSTLKSLADQLRVDLGIEKITSLTVVGFDGPRNTGSDHAWFAIYNNNHPNQKTAKQLFFSISNGIIVYALYDRLNNKLIDEKHIADGKFQYDTILEYYRNYVEEIQLDRLPEDLTNIKELIRKLENNDIKSWVFKPGPKAEFWENFLRNEVIKIGWGNTIDEIYSEKILDDSAILQSLNKHYNNGKTQINNKATIKNFINDFKIGDVIFTFQGNKEVIGIGIIKSDLLLDNENQEYKAFYEMQWLVNLIKSPYYPGYSVAQKTITALESRFSVEILKDIFFHQTIKDSEILENLVETNERDNNISLNQILYGPPGTGKTFHTINKALEILGYNFNGKSRVDIKADFEKYINSGQIVFTTFHQSLGYEDFIEGLKPLEPKNDGDPVTYKVIDGIFKLMCTNSLPFSIGEDINGYTVESVTRELLTLKKKRSDTLLPISLRMLSGLNRYLEENELSIDRVKEKISFTDEVKSAYPEIEPYLINGYNTIIPNLLKILNNTTSSNIPKVLIIDEINRGNVSQIFGELITLIEKDKRKGNSEELTVTLPYSKKEFGVPNNLYIIGTMNTADRSVEALDSALRRRFVFEEMKPQPEKIAEIRKQKNIDEKIDNIDLGELLTTINNRIEKLLDRDHTIGHSYFLDCKNIEELKDTFYKNIIPLLQEYFYGDYAKIGLILGAGFINPKEAKDILFAEFVHDNRELYDEKRLYEIVDYRGSTSQKVSLNGKEQELSFEQAIDLLLNRNISE